MPRFYFKTSLVSLSIFSFIFIFFKIEFTTFSNTENQGIYKKVLLDEKFQYANIEDFIELNVNSKGNKGWGMKGEYQFSPNILDSNNVDLNIFKSIKRGNKAKEGFGGISGNDLVKIINSNKRSTFENFNGKNWLTLDYRLPILKTDDRELLAKIINNEKFNTKESLNFEKNYSVYFSRNEIFANSDSLVLRINNEYELSWKVKLNNDFYLSEEKTIIGQIHNMDNYKYYSKNGDSTFGNPFLVFSVQILDGKPIWNIYANKLEEKTQQLFSSKIQLEKNLIYDFKVKLRMSSKMDGYIKVWLNDELISNVENVMTHLATIPTKNGQVFFENGYFKLGMYQPGWNKSIREAWRNNPYEYNYFEDIKFMEKKIWVTDVLILEN